MVRQDHCRPDGAFGCFVVEPLEDGKDELADLREQPAVVAEVWPQELGEGEDELPVRQRQKKPILHVLRKQKCSFLRAGRTEVKGFTRKRTEILESAFRIGALDSGDALGVVPAEDELLHRLGDALDSETAVDGRVLVFVPIGEALEVFLEQKLDRIDPARLIDPLLDRSELKE